MMFNNHTKKMGINELNKSIIEKAEFYKSNEVKCHVITIPKGTFKNGLFVSNLEPDKFFWFIADQCSIPIRLFLNDIYDIVDYQERV